MSAWAVPGKDAGLRDIVKRLSGKDRRSIGDAEGVARDLVQDETLVTQVVSFMSGPDPLLRARSADALEKAARRRPVILRAHRKALLRLMSTARQQEVRWHIAQVLPRLELTARERRAARRALFAYLSDESRIVQVCALQGLWDLAAPEERRRGPLRSLVEGFALEGSPALRARARQLLQVRRRPRKRG